MNTTDIDLMLAEKGKPCLSIVVPTHQYSRDRMQNPEIIEKTVRKAEDLLANSAWPKDQVEMLESKLLSLARIVDTVRMQEGLAMFVSPKILKIYLLPFQVKEKIMLGQTFEIRDIVYFNQLLRPYYLLAISKKRIRLFKGSGRDLQEVINNDFPKPYIEEYEYERPSLGSSFGSGLKAFEKDKSIVKESRQKTFYKQADMDLGKYLKGDSLLFAAGVEEALVNFEATSHYGGKLAGKIPGNYDLNALHPLAETAWKQVQAWVRNSHQQLLQKLDDYVGKKQVADGITNVWKTAHEGKGLILLVEKDYQAMAYFNPINKSQIYLTPPAGKYEIIIDAVDDVMEVVMANGGSITILENGALENFRHVALLLRYPG